MLSTYSILISIVGLHYYKLDQPMVTTITTYIVKTSLKLFSDITSLVKPGEHQPMTSAHVTLFLQIAFVHEFSMHARVRPPLRLLKTTHTNEAV